MLASPKLRVALKWAAPIVILTWCFAYFTTTPSTYSDVIRTFQDQRNLFLADFLEHDVEGVEFDGEPLAQMCASREWKSDLILTCDPVAEGIGSVRNAHLACIRLAIEMGANIIFPDIVKRSDHDIAQAVPNAKGPLRGESLSYFFDYDHLNATLSTHCPQMKTYPSINVLHDVPSVLTGLKVKISDLTTDVVNGTVMAHPERLAQSISSFIAANDAGAGGPRPRPLKVQLVTSLFWFPTAHDPPAFAASFGSILRVRRDARMLAGAALFAMRRVRLAEGSSRQIVWDPRRNRGETATGLLGVRVRTDRDVWQKNWPGYDEQGPYFLNLVSDNRERFPLVFLAQGMHANNVTSFAERCADFGVSVVTKHDLLADNPGDVAALKSLTWDQRALVDYEVMMRAEFVAGIAQSSFAWNLAVRRATTYSGGHDAAVPSGKIMFQDSHSVVFGPGMDELHEQAAGAMQATIWP